MVLFIAQFMNLSIFSCMLQLKVVLITASSAGFTDECNKSSNYICIWRTYILLFHLKGEPSSRPKWWLQSEGSDVLSWRASLVVHFYWLASCDRNQCCLGILHYALWVKIREGALHKLVGIHDHLLFSEYRHHSATEGETITLTHVL